MICQLAMANGVRRNAHILRRALEFEVKGQRKKGKLERKKKQIEEEDMKVHLSMENAPC